jgi:hypothetical protein
MFHEFYSFAKLISPFLFQGFSAFMFQVSNDLYWNHKGRFDGKGTLSDHDQRRVEVKAQGLLNVNMCTNPCKQA